MCGYFPADPVSRAPDSVVADKGWLSSTGGGSWIGLFNGRQWKGFTKMIVAPLQAVLVSPPIPAPTGLAASMVVRTPESSSPAMISEIRRA